MRTSGRRRHERFSPAEPWDGSISILRDVIVQVDRDGRLLAFGGAPGVVGEVMRLDVSGGGDSVAIEVEVIGSRPVMLGGTVRHRVELEVIEHGR